MPLGVFGKVKVWLQRGHIDSMYCIINVSSSPSFSLVQV